MKVQRSCSIRMVTDIGDVVAHTNHDFSRVVTWCSDGCCKICGRYGKKKVCKYAVK